MMGLGISPPETASEAGARLQGGSRKSKTRVGALSGTIMRMTYTELRYILAVARTRNFRRAAELCFVTQPALSLGVQSIEAELGVRIFERSRSSVQITPAGAPILAQAQRALDEFERVRSVAREGLDPLSGPLKVGVIFTIGPYLIPDLLPALAEVAPLMPLAIEENTTAQLTTQLKIGQIDVAILALPFGGPGFSMRPVYDESFEVVVRKDHPMARLRSVKPSQLHEHKVLLLGEEHCFANQVAEACPGVRDGGETPAGNSLETVRNMVASGFGITVLPAAANTERYRSPLLRSIAFAAPAPYRRVALAYRSSYTRMAAIDALERAIRTLASRERRMVAPRASKPRAVA
jgi:LysR family hydrogen peroxide-inducible transcriptional activator